MAVMRATPEQYFDEEEAKKLGETTRNFLSNQKSSNQLQEKLILALVILGILGILAIVYLAYLSSKRG